MELKDITIIIPIHEATSESKELFKDACDNATKVHPDGKVIVVGPKAVLKGLDIPKGFKKVENEVSDLPHQINAAVAEVKTTYFTVLEIDDNITSYWFNEAKAYAEENPGCAVYFPIVEVYDDKATDPNKAAVGYMNEVTWATSFSQEMGFFDVDSLLNFPGVCASGAIFDKEIYDAVGGLKASMKIFYWYEYFLRTANKGRKLYVVPKIGYNHLVNRDGSMTNTLEKEMSQDEIDWWFTLAQQEYTFKNDRGKQYITAEE